ncbi:MAG: hypothetical protein ACJ77A_08190 [Actinomycetota bacterium]
MVRPRRRLKTAIAIATLVVLGGGTAAVLATRGGQAGRAAPPASGDLMARVLQLVRTMPGPGSDGYDIPTRAEASAMASAFGAVQDGNLDEAAGIAGPFGYVVQPFSDTATGRHLVLMAERRNPDGSWPHAWGMFVFSPGSRSRLVVDVAHPFDDIDTPQVGVETFRLAGARALLVAGASRYAADEGASDMAHATGTVFDAVHRSLLSPGVLVFEPHGFETASHEDYGNVVVSSGAFPPQPLARRAAAALLAAGFRVCLYDGSRCSALGATTNVQGASTRETGGQFLHVEMAPVLRSTEQLRHRVAEAIARAAG